MSWSCCPTGTSRTALALAAGRPAGAGATPLTETDWAALLEPVARELLGDPVRRPASGEWRYRRKGSLAVRKRKGGVLTLDATEANQLSGLKIRGTSNPASCEDSEPCPRRRPGIPTAPSPCRPAKT